VSRTGGLRLGLSHDCGHDDGHVADAVEAALRRLGHDVERLGGGPQLFDALRARDPSRRLDGVVNLAGGRGDRRSAAQIPALLHTLGIPHTGAEPLALALALDDGLARSFAAAHGIRTVADGDEPLPGDEYSIGVLGNGERAAVLCVLCRPGRPAARAARMFRTIRTRADERLAHARALAVAVHRVFGCHDVSRVELRCDHDGAPAFVSVDPLPDLRPAGDLARGARRRGWSHDELIRRILAAAVARWRPSRPAEPEPEPPGPTPPSPDHPSRAGARCASPSPTTPTPTSNPI
jgi:hypothetical protein